MPYVSEWTTISPLFLCKPVELIQTMLSLGFFHHLDGLSKTLLPADLRSKGTQDLIFWC